MNNQKIAMESLSMDLYRVAVGLQRGSLKMANRFKEEALKREVELESNEPDEYLQELLVNSKKALLKNNPDTAEDILMYSTLFQNLAQKRYSEENH